MRSNFKRVIFILQRHTICFSCILSILKLSPFSLKYLRSSLEKHILFLRHSTNESGFAFSQQKKHSITDVRSLFPSIIHGCCLVCRGENAWSVKLQQQQKPSQLVRKVGSTICSGLERMYWKLYCHINNIQIGRQLVKMQQHTQAK